MKGIADMACCPFLRRLALLLCLILPALAMAGRKLPKEEPAIVAQARSVARQDLDEGLAVLEGYLTEGKPNRDLVPWVLLNAGELRRVSLDHERARAHFTSLRDRYPDHFLKEAALLGIALVDAGENPSGNQIATLALMEAPFAPPTLDADRYRLLALDAIRRNENAEKIRGLAARAEEGARGFPLVEARVRASLGAHVEATGTEDPTQAAAGDPSLRRLREALLRKDFENAARIAESYIATFPASPSVAEARFAQKRIDRKDPYKPEVVGVLLPLSGPFALPAARIRTIIEVANGQTGHPFTLVFKDEGSTPESAASAVEALALDHGAAVVIGPLLKETARGAADTAQALRLPLVTLTQAERVTEDRDCVFRAFLTPEQQVQALLDHAMGDRQLKSFGVLAPDTPFGHLVSDAFTLHVATRGGSAPSVVFYDPTQGDFRKAAARLARKDPVARAGELARLRRLAKDKGMDPDKVVLPPAVELDGIFIPDQASRVPLIASALAYEEFAVGAFKPRFDAVPSLVMGLNGWHDDQIAVDGGRYLRGGIFVDAFDPRDPSAVVSRFVSAVRPGIQEPPGVVEAMVWDASRMVFEALSTRPAHREAVREALLQVRLRDPVAGGDRFDARREVARNLLVFVIGERGVQRYTGPDASLTP